MKTRRLVRPGYLTVLLCTAPVAFSQSAPAAVAFTVSMPQPASHLFHVSLRCDGLQGETQDFKLPVWTPGYYRVLDYARNVSGFRAEDRQGRTLAWERVTRNTWRVVTAGASAVTVSYDVYGATTFAAQNYLGENRAFITPPGLFMYPAGGLRRAVTVDIQPPPNWTRIASGLDPVPGRPAVFSAPDFDVLYDCPILMGNQELLRFEVNGVPHEVALENVPAGVDRVKMLADLKKLVETATGVIGDVPYTHYTFLMMGQGNGGIEHLNSAAIAFNGASLTTENGYRGWLSYVTHEYFHNFNVKRIRPIALGPFDYEAENLTNMLWVSEGLSVYYQDLVMVRAGLMTRGQYLDKMKASMARFENAPGHRYQSATDSSATTWGTSGVGGDRNTTISYYDNGAMLGAMLDLKIRAESQNRKSLDDVMRSLYRTYYQSRKRGFTDAEFRQECESAAGGPLTEVFEYASTTKDADYAKYFALAGLSVEVAAEDAPGAALGLNLQTRDGKLIVSEATAAGFEAGDEILEADGARATPKALNDLLAAKKPGETVKIHCSRSGAIRDVELVLVKAVKRSYDIHPVPNPSALKSTILKSWL